MDKGWNERVALGGAQEVWAPWPKLTGGASWGRKVLCFLLVRSYNITAQTHEMEADE